ncbi:hypothetical protein [Desmospora activa]|uniref:Uncharacterized protein n=1 Tax=Desmospora activa DSM 45169 TaxID=1121389 RepID=A0A2T4ZDK4_9BACL|nr:hypothetical protein [Desmospora activa]PTM59936.1 hypothetical protein C8J48_2573 [Desmospora activa DSM 45169]
MRSWFKKSMVWLIGLCILTACGSVQAVPSLSNVDPAKEEDQEFHPYRDDQVPKLRDLISYPGFRQYASQKPYLLGYSHDGSHIATVIYEKKANAYRIDIFHVSNNTLVETVYAPAGEVEGEKAESAEAEMLQATQETLDWGYRIKVPVRPHEVPIHQSIHPDHEEGWSFRLRQDSDRILLTAEGLGEKWQVYQYPLQEGERIRPQWTVVAFPESTQGPWSIVTATYKPEQGLSALVQSVDIQKLDSAWSESALHQQIEKGLGEEAQLVYRGRLGEQGPDAVLAVLGGEASETPTANRVLYRGTVQRFILFDTAGNIYLRGNAAGLVEKEQVRVDPEIPKDDDVQFRLLLTEKETGDGERQRLLLIDQIDGEGHLVRAYECIWNAENGRFERMTAKGAE